MEAKPEIYIPSVFKNFQGFQVKDIKEWRSEEHMEIILEDQENREHLCDRCGCRLGALNGRYWLSCRHLRVMGWKVSVGFFREKRYCPNCKKIRSERIDFICETSPHVTKELAWWITRLSEITSVLSVSNLESIDKMTCYAVDKYILRRLLEGYKIPLVSHISVDEVYARSSKQQKDGETRDDLFLTIIVDFNTHKVIWVSKSRRKQALDEFFMLIGPEACRNVRVVATDQHEGYAASVKEFCPNAVVVWDRFHLVQRFNEALNDDRKAEQERLDPEGEMEDLVSGKYRYIFLTKAANRRGRDQRHIAEVMRLNQKMAKLEIIKEHFHKMFECEFADQAKLLLADIYQWAQEAKAINVFKWVSNTLRDPRFWNYFKFKFTTGLSEGINRAIKGLKWQAYGYKNMDYFALKILQKCGYLNHRYYLSTNK
jgi:transposase